MAHLARLCRSLAQVLAAAVALGTGPTLAEVPHETMPRVSSRCPTFLQLRAQRPTLRERWLQAADSARQRDKARNRTFDERPAEEILVASYWDTLVSGDDTLARLEVLCRLHVAIRDNPESQQFYDQFVCATTHSSRRMGALLQGAYDLVARHLGSGLLPRAVQNSFEQFSQQVDGWPACTEPQSPPPPPRSR